MNSNMTQLDISTVSPVNGSNGNKLDSTIKVTFTRDLNKATILKNFVVIEDLSGNINTIDDLNKKVLSVVNGKMSYINPFKVVQGTIEYSDKVVSYKPVSVLSKGKRYCIVVRSEITSIYGETLFSDYLFRFSTIGESVVEEEKIPSPTIHYPTDFSIINKLSNVDLVSQNIDDGIYLQVSTTNEFNNIVFEYSNHEFVDKIIIDKDLPDDNYFIRAKTFKSEWCDITSVYIQRYDNMPVSVEDELNSFDYLFDELNDEALEITVKDVDKRLSSRMNKILIEFNKVIDINKIDDISISLVKNLIFDDIDYDEFFQLQSYSSFIDIKNNKTYIMLEV